MNNTIYSGALSGFAVDHDEYFNKKINFSYITNSISTDTQKLYNLSMPDLSRLMLMVLNT